MSATKINNSEAHSLAHRIANKAFEHLIEPAEDRYNSSAKKAYDKLIANIGGEEVARTLALYRCADQRETVQIEVKGNAESPITARYKAPKGRAFYFGLSWNNPLIIDVDLFDEISEQQRIVSDLTDKRNQLAYELCKQMEGRSAKKMLTAWPEAESIFQEFFGVTGGGEISTPLESLLAKFLPMLAAPVGA